MTQKRGRGEHGEADREVGRTQELGGYKPRGRSLLLSVIDAPPRLRQGRSSRVGVRARPMRVGEEKVGRLYSLRGPFGVRLSLCFSSIAGGEGVVKGDRQMV
jgi:hypothetical protein